MRIIAYIACLITLPACQGRLKNATIESEKTKHTAIEQKDVDSNTIFKSFRLVDDYFVTDTGFFDFGIGDGVYAVLKKDDQLVDTIDFAYKMQKVNDQQLMYISIVGTGPISADLTNRRYKRSIKADIGSFIIIDSKGKKTDVSNTAPDFGWFASPSIIDGLIYYWKVTDIKDNNQIFAAQFNPSTKATKSCYLFNDPIDSDAGSYFDDIYKKDGVIIFKSPKGKAYKFSPDFKLIQ